MTKLKMERIERAKQRAIKMEQNYIDLDIARLYQLTAKDLDKAVTENILHTGYIQKAVAPKFIWQTEKVYKWE